MMILALIIKFNDWDWLKNGYKYKRAITTRYS